MAQHLALYSSSIANGAVLLQVTNVADVIVATSGNEATELTQDGIAQRRVVVRPNGIDLGALLCLPPRGSFRARCS